MKCPACGAENSLVIQYAYQYCHEHRILKNGKISKEYKRVDIGSEDWSSISCNSCGAYWSDQERNGFSIDKEERIHFEREDEEE